MTGRAEALLSGPPIGLPDTRKQKCREHGMWRGILRPLPGRQARVPVFPATGRVYGGWGEGAMLCDSGTQMRPGNPCVSGSLLSKPHSCIALFAMISNLTERAGAWAMLRSVVPNPHA